MPDKEDPKTSVDSLASHNPNSTRASSSKNMMDKSKDKVTPEGKGQERKRQVAQQTVDSYDTREEKKRRDRPVIAEQYVVDPNRMVTNAATTVRLTGHPCATICQKLGLSNCCCNTKANIQDLFIAIAIMIKRLVPVNWQIFHKPPVWVHRPHHHHFRIAEPQHDHELLEEQDALNLLLLDHDLHEDFALTEDPFLMILRVLVPIGQVTREFELFLKQLAGELGDVDNVEDLAERGYQMQHEPEQGIALIRMPRPEHHLMFMQQLARKGFINMSEHNVLDHFARLMQARHGAAIAPRPVPGALKRNKGPLDFDEEMRNPFNPTPFKKKLRLEPNS